MNNYNREERKYAPIQILHDFQMVALNVKDDYSALEHMNFQEKKRHMRERLEKLAECGYGGVCLNVDFKNYLQNDESFILLDQVIDIAVELGFRVWLYDEQYYPSGAAGGLVLKNHPELESQGLACVSKMVTGRGVAVRIPSPTGHSGLKYAYAVPYDNGKLDFEHQVDISNCKDLAGGLCWECETGEWKVYCFFVRVLFEMTYLTHSLRATRRYPNIADKSAVKRFLDITYEKYEKYFKGPLGNRVEAVFTDEPSLMCYSKMPEKKSTSSPTRFPSVSIHDDINYDIPSYPYIPWINGMEEIFFKRYGYQLPSTLPEIFDEGPNTEQRRIDFYGLINELVEDAYMHTMHDYTSSQGMLLSGHYLHEEYFDRHPFLYGDILKHLGNMDIPGCDFLYSEVEKLKYAVECRLASSAAHIYQKPYVMIEASNMVDKNQNLTLDNMRAAISLMYIHGIDTITSYYGENIFGTEDKKKFTEYTMNLGKLHDGGKRKANTLLFYPYKQLCAMKKPEGENGVSSASDSLRIAETMEMLLKRQICFDFMNEECLQKCRIQNGEFYTEYGEKIDRIVFPNIDFVEDSVGKIVNQVQQNNVEIVFYGLERKIRGIDFEPVFVNAPCEIQKIETELIIQGDYPDLLLSHIAFEEYELYMLMNAGKEQMDLKITYPGICTNLESIDPVTMESIKLKSNVYGDKTVFEVCIGECKCMLIRVQNQ